MFDMEWHGGRVGVVAVVLSSRHSLAHVHFQSIGQLRNARPVFQMVAFQAKAKDLLSRISKCILLPATEKGKRDRQTDTQPPECKCYSVLVRYMHQNKKNRAVVNSTLARLD